MIISLALVLFATASGTLVSYLYDEEATFPGRLCAGTCVGLTALGLVGFLFAKFLGLTPLSIGLTVGVLALAALVLKGPRRRAVVQNDLAANYNSLRRVFLHPSRIPLGVTAFYLLVSAILWRVFQRSMIELPDGIYTGVLNNFGDLPFHLSVISSFAFGNNFLPEDPTYAGVRFTYPFLADFVSAIFVRCGADLRQSMFIENFTLAISFVGLLHRWALEMVRDRLAGPITPILVLLNGGLGWTLLWKLKPTSEGLSEMPPSFTVIPETTWRWGNAISSLLIPQRGMLLGLPLAVIVFTQWWLATGDGGKGRKLDGANKQKTRKLKSSKARNSPGRPISPSSRLPVSSAHRMIAAGIVAGFIPLVHAHSFVTIMVVGFFIGLLQRRWREWITFFVVASAIALPQMWWSTHNSAVNSAKFFEWQLGWDRGNDNIVCFWFKNSGLFIPLTIAALLWRDKEYLVPRKLLLFFLPFTLCFIVPNLLRMAPWIWDNIKVLFYWWLASAPLVALLLARLWHKGPLKKLIALALLTSITFAGALDVAAIALRSKAYQVFDSSGIQFAELIKRQTEPRALIVHAPVHNHPVFLTGRRSLMGYPGHIWTHGLEFVARESEIRKIYAGAPDAMSLLWKYKIEYAVVGPLERSVMNVNDQFFSRFAEAGDVGEYRLYKIKQP